MSSEKKTVKNQRTKIWQWSLRHHVCPVETVRNSYMLTFKDHFQNLTSDQGQVMLHINRHGLKEIGRLPSSLALSYHELLEQNQ